MFDNGNGHGNGETFAGDMGSVASPWTQDAQGYLRTPSGVKAARVDRNSVIWLWDHKSKREYPLTPADLRACITRIEDQDHES